jgi:hypothetical protein
MSHAMGLSAGIGAHGLWSVSRGLARGLEAAIRELGAQHKEARRSLRRRRGRARGHLRPQGKAHEDLMGGSNVSRSDSYESWVELRNARPDSPFARPSVLNIDKHARYDLPRAHLGGGIP